MRGYININHSDIDITGSCRILKRAPTLGFVFIERVGRDVIIGHEYRAAQGCQKLLHDLVEVIAVADEPVASLLFKFSNVVLFSLASTGTWTTEASSRSELGKIHRVLLVRICSSTWTVRCVTHLCP